MNRIVSCLWILALACLPACEEVDQKSDNGAEDVTILETVCADEVSDLACRRDTDCKDGRHCFSPGQRNCGICMRPENTCLGDDNCEAWPGTICDYPLYNDCYCDWGKLCIPPCGVEGGTVCDSQDRPACVDGRCVRQPCETDSDCPDLFWCSLTDEGIGCERKLCQDDSDCEDCGWCVHSVCYAEPGHCDYMAP